MEELKILIVKMKSKMLKKRQSECVREMKQNGTRSLSTPVLIIPKRESEGSGEME